MNFLTGTRTLRSTSSLSQSIFLPLMNSLTGTRTLRRTSSFPQSIFSTPNEFSNRYAYSTPY